MNLHDLNAWVEETCPEEAFRDIWDTAYYDRSPEARRYRDIVIRGLSSLLTGIYDDLWDYRCASHVLTKLCPFRELYRFELTVARIHGIEPKEFEQQFGYRAADRPPVVVRWKLLATLIREERLDWLEKILRQPLRRASHAGGRPLRGPDMLIVAKMLEEERGLCVGRFLTPAEREQFEVFLTEHDDKVLAVRWGIKETAVRRRRSRLRKKIGRVIPDLVTTPLYTEGRNDEVNDVTNAAVIEAIKAEGEKTRQAIENEVNDVFRVLATFHDAPARDEVALEDDNERSTP